MVFSPHSSLRGSDKKTESGHVHKFKSLTRHNKLNSFIKIQPIIIMPSPTMLIQPITQIQHVQDRPAQEDHPLICFLPTWRLTRKWKVYIHHPTQMSHMPRIILGAGNILWKNIGAFGCRSLNMYFIIKGPPFFSQSQRSLFKF